MSTDAELIERLRKAADACREMFGDPDTSAMHEAADRLAALIAERDTATNALGILGDEFAPMAEYAKALQAERDRLKEALKPFAEYRAPTTFDEWLGTAQVVMTVRAGDVRRAKAALSPTQEKPTATCEYCGQATADALPAICMKCYADACENAP